MVMSARKYTNWLSNFKGEEAIQNRDEQNGFEGRVQN